MRRIGFGIVLLLAACKDDPQIKFRESATESFTQVPPSAVDILWIVDDSVSMQEEQFKVQEGSGLFVETLDEAGVDFHLAITTTDIPGDGGVFVGDPPYVTRDTPDYAETFRDRVDDVGLHGDHEESGLEAAALALTSPNADGPNAGFARSDAKLSIIVLSDEDDCSEFGELFVQTEPTEDEPQSGDQCVNRRDELTPVAEILDMYYATKSDASLVQVSGIVEASDTECSTAVPGTRYEEAADLTGGLTQNICESDYGIIMDELGLRAAGMLFEFELAHVPYPDSIEAWIFPETGTEYQVLEDRADGWVLRSDPPTVVFHGDGIPPRGSTVTISYEY